MEKEVKQQQGAEGPILDKNRRTIWFTVISDIKKYSQEQLVLNRIQE